MLEGSQRQQLEYAVLCKAFRHAQTKTAQTLNSFAGTSQEISRIDMLQAKLWSEQYGVGVSLESFVFHGLHIDDLGENDKVAFRLYC